MNRIIKYFWIKTAMPKWLCLLRIWYMKVFIGIKVVGNKCLISKLKLSVVIPVVEKDLLVLPYVVESIRIYLKHPIDKILIIGPNKENIASGCKKLNCVFINETKVGPIQKSDIDYVVDGVDRSGWLYQQILKLSADKLVNTDDYLIMDADTVLTSPICFEKDDNIIFDCSTEKHLPYYEMYQRLIGVKPESKVSFVAHHMLINNKILSEMKNCIEMASRMNWYKAIMDELDRKEISGFSEFETYGNYFFKTNANRMIFRFWDNFEVGPRMLARYSVLEILKLFEYKYLTVSFHSYFPKLK
jgi:hypothetical protein